MKSATAYALNEVVNADDVGKNLTKVKGGKKTFFLRSL